MRRAFVMAVAALALSAIAVVVSHCCEGAGRGEEAVAGTVVTSRVHQVEGAAVGVSEIGAAVAVVVVRTGATEADEVPVDGDIRPIGTGSWDLPPLAPPEPNFLKALAAAGLSL